MITIKPRMIMEQSFYSEMLGREVYSCKDFERQLVELKKNTGMDRTFPIEDNINLTLGQRIRLYFVRRNNKKRSIILKNSSPYFRKFMRGKANGKNRRI